jgi:hypothetical protein
VHREKLQEAVRIGGSLRKVATHSDLADRIIVKSVVNQVGLGAVRVLKPR